MKHLHYYFLTLAVTVCCNVHAQKAYIYVHEKTLNEQSNGQFAFSLSGTTSASFTLDNNPAYILAGDLGASHSPSSTSTAADGELWVIGNSSATLGTTTPNITGTIYHRAAGSSQWTAISSTTTASAIDGGYTNQCAYIAGGNAYFYDGTNTYQIYSNTFSGGNAIDIGCGYGVIAIIGSNNHIYVNQGNYTSGGLNNISDANSWWKDISGTTSSLQAARLDINITGTTIAYLNSSNTAEIYTVSTGGGTPTLVETLPYGNGNATTNDIAYDDNGHIYANGGSTDDLPEVWSNASGSWAEEDQSGYIDRLTGGAGGQVWGICDDASPETIFSRTTDGTASWFDDERVRTASVGNAFADNTGYLSGGATNGNSIMIPVTAGTYTLTQTLPDNTWDLGRFKTYVPSTSSVTTNVTTNTITINVAAGDIVHVEFVDEKLNPTAIGLTCTTQILQTFGTDPTGSSTVAGTNTFGDPMQGTLYHYWTNGDPHDGSYYLVKNTDNWFSVGSLTDHGGQANGYFMLVNASYSKDEFYRQRITNLVPGLLYTISFYAANVSYGQPIDPNIYYGMEDLSANVLASASTGNITTNQVWTNYTLTFTATASTADLFLTNNNIGGNGNDLAIDDISLNPVTITLGSNSISPSASPNICTGTTYTFSNTLSGGLWSSSAKTVATVNAKTGQATGLTAGTAIITYTYSNQIGCTSTAATSITVSTTPTVSVSDQLGGNACIGQTDSLYSTPSGGTGSYTYLWSASPSSGGGLSSTNTQNSSATPTAGGTTYTYTLLLTDAGGCSASGSVSVNTPNHNVPTVTASESSSPYCTNSAITLSSSASGGSGSYTYAWTASPTGNGLGTANTQNTTATPTAAGSYTYKVTVNDGYCSVSKSVAAAVNSSPSVTASGPTGTQQLCNNSSYVLSSSPSGGSGTYSYSWTGSRVSGNDNTPGLQSPATTQNVIATPGLMLSNSPNPDVYKYTVTITDGNGCTATASASVTAYLNAVASAPTVSITSPSSASSVCSGSSITLGATATAGFAATISGYSWTGPGSYTSTSLSPGTVTPSATGNYTLTVTETNGCKASAVSPAITVNAKPSITASNFASGLCNNTADSVYSTATGGTLPYSYGWAVGGSGTLMTVSSPTKDTSAVTAGTSGNTYTFNVKVTDANGCTAAASTSIKYTAGSGPLVNVQSSNLTSECIGSPNGLAAIDVNDITGITGTVIGAASGDGEPLSNAFDGNTATFYDYGNANGGWVGMDFGSAVSITLITYYPRLTLESRMVGGEFQASSTADFSSGVVILATITSTPSDAYHNVVVTASGSYRYYRYLSPNGGWGDIAEMNFYKVAGGDTYLWSASPTGNGLGSTTTSITSATPTVAGTYTYTLKATSSTTGCSALANITGTTESSAVAVTVTPGNADFCGTTGTEQLYAAASGGSGTYSSYAWTGSTVSGSGTTTLSSSSIYDPVASLSSASTGNSFKYSVTITDNNGCTGTASTTIPVVSTPTISSVAATPSSTCAGATVTLKASFSGGTSAYNYIWSAPSNSAITTSSGSTSSSPVTTTATTTAGQNYVYGFFIDDANGCSASGNSTLFSLNQVLGVSLSANNYAPCADPATTISLTGTLTTSSTAPYTYAWSGSGVVNNTGSITTTATPTTSGAYGLIVTDANGCTGSASTSTVTPDQATPSISVNCNGTSVELYESTGASWLWTTTSGGRFYPTSAYGYSADSSTSHLQGPFINYMGSYSVQITDSKGCIGTGSTTVSSCSSLLAVNLLQFTARKQANQALLEWSTASETNNKYFDVERSADGMNWQTIGSVQGQGTTNTVANYTYTDQLPLNGINYYRLKQVDANGVYTYSTIRPLDFSGLWLVKLYPNPAQSFVMLEFNNDKDETASIIIQNVLGSVVFATQQPVVMGLNQINLNQVQRLAQGTYVITMRTATNIFRSKFIKGGN